MDDGFEVKKINEMEKKKESRINTGDGDIETPLLEAYRTQREINGMNHDEIDHNYAKKECST